MRPYTKNGKLHIPAWCVEDTPLPLRETTEGDDTLTGIPARCEGDLVVTIDEDEHICTGLEYEDYRKLRRMTYFACNWYPRLIEQAIPTISSKLIRTSMLDLREDLRDHFTGEAQLSMNDLEAEGLAPRWFVRLCGSSPKDMIDVPIYSNPDKACDDLMRSQRTLKIMTNYSHDNKFHLFLRDVVDIDYECRCFIHEHRLRAVSVYQFITPEQRKEFEVMILDFMEEYQDRLPYNSCVMELGMEEGGFPFVVEFNSFGIDGFADASLFDWDRECSILYHSTAPEFRYPHLLV